MEEQQSVLSSLNIDETVQMHLISIAKWNRFMAIAGIIMSALTIIALSFGGTYVVSSFSKFNRTQSVESINNGNGVFAIMFGFWIMCMVIYLIPCFFRLQFSNKMLKALAHTDQEMLNESLNAFKTYSKYWGILTIIGAGITGLYLVIFAVALLGTLGK